MSWWHLLVILKTRLHPQLDGHVKARVAQWQQNFGSTLQACRSMYCCCAAYSKLPGMRQHHSQENAVDQVLWTAKHEHGAEHIRHMSQLCTSMLMGALSRLQVAAVLAEMADAPDLGSGGPCLSLPLQQAALGGY